MVDKSVKDNHISSDFEEHNKRTDVNSFRCTPVLSEIFIIIDRDIITGNNLTHFLSDCNSKCFVSVSKFIQFFSEVYRNCKLESHFNPINLSKSSKVMGFNLPDSKSSKVLSQDTSTDLAKDFLTSLLSL